MNREEKRQYMKEYYHRHRQEILKNMKEKYATDEEYRNTVKNNWKNYRDTHKKEIAEKMKDYQKLRKESLSQYNADYYSKNVETISERKRKKRQEIRIIEQDDTP